MARREIQIPPDVSRAVQTAWVPYTYGMWSASGGPTGPRASGLALSQSKGPP
jgi:hypothetical protein